MEFYLLCCDTPQNGGGIGHYRFLRNGKLKKLNFYSCDRPMYAVKEDNRLYVLLRQSFENGESGVFSLDLDLNNPTPIASTGGRCACHLCVDEEDCYIVNYLSGNVVNIGKNMVKHQGKGINPIRQDMSHTHQVFFSLDQKYVLCCDLGLDTLFCYDRALHLVSSAKVADGYGIRHAVFSKDGKYIYALSEMVPAVHVFSFNEGKVSFLKKYDISCEKEKADGAAIRLSKDGKKLYISLRIENALVTFDVNGVALQFQQKIDCGGDSPRDFWVTDDYLIVTNEKSNNVVIYPIQNGSLVPEKVADISVVAPLCCIVNM